jgi:hypothetical protein
LADLIIDGWLDHEVEESGLLRARIGHSFSKGLGLGTKAEGSEEEMALLLTKREQLEERE